MYTEDTTEKRRGATDAESEGPSQRPCVTLSHPHSTLPFATQQKIQACRALYLAFQGRHHEAIEREMRALGHTTFNRRILYARNQHGRTAPGWPALYGWEALLTAETQRRMSEPPASAGGQSEGDEIPTVSPKPAQLSNWPPAHAGGSDTRSDFRSWLKRTFPHMQWDHDHIRYVCDVLERFTRGEIRRLIVCMPPRHGKSELVTQKYGAYRLLRDPKMRIIIGSHNQTLATEFSLGVKKAMAEDAAVTELESQAQASMPGADDRAAARVSVPGADGFSTRRAVSRPQPTGALTLKPGSLHDPESCDECQRRARECPYLAESHDARSPVATAPGSDTQVTASSSAPGTDTPTAAAHNLIERLTALLTSQTSSTSQTFQTVRRINRGSRWQTAEGGGVLAVGVGGGVTGHGANLVIIDDPVKGREVAESQSFRNKMWKWFTDDISTRMQPGGQMILIQTRWHEDDLAGRILRDMRENPKAEQWTVINLPALAEPPASANGECDSNGKLKMENGKCSERAIPPFVPPPTLPVSGADALQARTRGYNNVHKMREDDARAGYEQLYGVKIDDISLTAETQRRGESNENSTPSSLRLSVSAVNSSETSETFQTSSTDILGRQLGQALCPEWFSAEELEEIRRQMGSYSFLAMYQQRPVPAEGSLFKQNSFKIIERAPASTNWKRGYDLGLGSKPGADYTATAKVGFDHEGNMYIDDVRRKRMEYPEQRRLILGLIKAERTIEHIIEESANGHAVIQDLRREQEVRGAKLRGIRVKENKVARTFGWQALAEDGHVYLIKGPWNDDFIEEACFFPNAPHDDQIDAVSIAVKQFNERRGRTFWTF